MRIGSLCFVMVLLLVTDLRAQLRINELLAANRLDRPDAAGDFPDWVEIVNAGPLSINLAGYSLTDDPRRAQKWFFPAVDLAPGRFFVVWCSGKSHGDTEDWPHTNFKLGRRGERLEIHAADGSLIDGVTFPPQTEDHTWGRVPDATGAWSYLIEPTPGQANKTLASASPFPARPTIEPAPGVLAEAPVVTIGADLPVDVVLHYTTDGSSPTIQSARYTEPFTLHRSTVVRAAGFFDTRRVTQITTRSYFLDASEFELPILSIAMAPEDFRFVQLSNQQRGRAVERGGHIEFFDANGQLDAAAGMGLRLHGGAGRSGPFSIKKSYRTYYRQEYGDGKLRLQLLDDTDVRRFDRLVLRANTADAPRGGNRATLIRDQVIRNLHRDMGQLTAHGTWYNLFVNMQYHGVYNVTERLDRKFFSSYFDDMIDDDWDVVAAFGGALDGTLDAWEADREFFANGGFSDEALYEEALGRVDIDNFTSYIILEVWAQNHDWPANNWIMARPRRADGTWTFHVWDAEAGLGLSPDGYGADSFEHFFSSGVRGQPVLFEIFTGLLENDHYQQYFIEELDRHLDGVLSSEHVLEVIASEANRIAGDIPEETAAPNGNLTWWLAALSKVEKFAANRGPVIRKLIFNSNRITVPRARAIDPDRITLTASATVFLEGRNLTPQSEILFNDVPSPRVEFLSPVSMEVDLPYDLRIAGHPDITVKDGTSTVTSPDLLQVTFPRPIVVNIQPTSGSEVGGEEVLISGVNFLEDVQVLFGDTPAPVVENFFGTAVLLRVITPPGIGRVEVRAVNTRPGDLPGEATLPFTYLPASPTRLLVRGDGNGDGRVNLGDAVFVLNFLFHAGEHPCDDALDIDDSGAITITDPVFLLDYLFRPAKPPPPEPVAACGVDPTADALRCADSKSCPLE